MLIVNMSKGPIPNKDALSEEESERMADLQRRKTVARGNPDSRGMALRHEERAELKALESRWNDRLSPTYFAPFKFSPRGKPGCVVRTTAAAALHLQSLNKNLVAVTSAVLQGPLADEIRELGNIEPVDGPRLPTGREQQFGTNDPTDLPRPRGDYRQAINAAMAGDPGPMGSNFDGVQFGPAVPADPEM